MNRPVQLSYKTKRGAHVIMILPLSKLENEIKKLYRQCIEADAWFKDDPEHNILARVWTERMQYNLKTKRQFGWNWFCEGAS